MHAMLAVIVFKMLVVPIPLQIAQEHVKHFQLLVFLIVLINLVVMMVAVAAAALYRDIQYVMDLVALNLNVS